MKAIDFFHLAILVAFMVVLYGWGVNGYELIVGAIDFTAASNWAFLALRAVGLFVFPLGAVLGLFF